MGDMFFNNRVFGQLVLSRAFGDHALKKYGVISQPFTLKSTINDGDLIVMGSDGIWDVISNEDMTKFSKEYINSAEEFAKFIIKTAINNGSKDNLSCIVIKKYN